MESKQSTTSVTLLDCTLRDGGYYNQWHFSKALAQHMTQSLAQAGVQIIELGYKVPSFAKKESVDGLFRFCPESQLSFLKETPAVEYAFMADTKEFLLEGKVVESEILKATPPQNQSLFTWVRLATHFNTYAETLELAKIFKALGYQTTINLMGISLLTETQVTQALQQTDVASVDVFYFADSFGNLHQSDIINYIQLIREHYAGKVGIHTHDNQGLAFANTLTAMEQGIDLVDSTIMGMGRGAGNLKTEQLFLYLYFQDGYKHLNPSELLDVINEHFIPLHQQHQWGWDYSYMLSALKNIHPTYCQQLKSTKQYSIAQISNTLNFIEKEKRSKYDFESLTQAIDQAVKIPVVSQEHLVELPVFQVPQMEQCLVIGTGPSVKEHQAAIVEYIKQKQPTVIECNPSSSVFEEVSEQYYKTILNWVRLQTAFQQTEAVSGTLITGIPSVPESFMQQADIYYLPFQLSTDHASFEKEALTLPAYVVGMFSIGLAFASQAQGIQVVGFDGYPAALIEKNREMETFLEQLPSSQHLVSLTPTHYPIPSQSIYSVID